MALKTTQRREVLIVVEKSGSEPLKVGYCPSRPERKRPGLGGSFFFFQVPFRVYSPSGRRRKGASRKGPFRRCLIQRGAPSTTRWPPCGREARLRTTHHLCGAASSMYTASDTPWLWKAIFPFVQVKERVGANKNNAAASCQDAAECIQRR